MIEVFTCVKQSIHIDVQDISYLFIFFQSPKPCFHPNRQVGNWKLFLQHSSVTFSISRLFQSPGVLYSTKVVVVVVVAIENYCSDTAGSAHVSP